LLSSASGKSLSLNSGASKIASSSAVSSSNKNKH
jgi:hypothetical protein